MRCLLRASGTLVRRKWPGRLAGVLLGLSVLAAGGCGGGGGSGNGAMPSSRGALGAGHSPPFDQAAPGAAVCSGADLSGVRTAIYVSPQGTEDPNCGTTITATCKSVQQAIHRCTSEGCAVLVRHGLYAPATPTTPIELNEGVSVYGSCRFGGEPDRKYRTVIQASPAGTAGSPVIVASNIQSATTVQGLVIIGRDEGASGSPSIAMAVSGSRGLVLANSVLVAGRGGQGATGASSNGLAGGPGFAPTCATCRGMPGAACPSSPPSGVGTGGAGAASNVYDSFQCIGRCRCDQNAQNVSDSLGLVGQNSGAAIGGGGANPGGIGCSCYSAELAAVGDTGLENPGTGNTGGTGQPGACSAQGGTASSLVWGAPAQGTVWVPGSGGAGATGSVGAGGGGGGAGGFSTWDGDDRDGMPGGGGGGGGCGGTGGSGGQQGGASIALLLVDSAVTQVASVNSLVPGPGGDGGPGGKGGLGGPGGSGGAGMVGGTNNFDVRGTCHTSFAPASGGPGGAGGAGGAGSGGAGGNGGPSIGIALRGASTVPRSSSGIYAGTPGSGGGPSDGGVNPNCTGAPGGSGVAGGAARIVNLDQGAAVGAR
jgi:hypothetical protein